MASNVSDADQPTIRYATKDDVPQILAMIHELAAYEKASSSVLATTESLLSTLSFPPFPPATGFAKTLLIFPASSPSASSTSSPSSDVLPAGMALFFHNYSTWRAAPGVYLEDLFVRPEFRGKGYGRLLLRELARVTREVGGKRLEWSVLKWNEPSIRFYQGKSVNATRMEEWVGMRVEEEALEKLAE